MHMKIHHSHAHRWCLLPNEWQDKENCLIWVRMTTATCPRIGSNKTELLFVSPLLPGLFHVLHNKGVKLWHQPSFAWQNNVNWSWFSEKLPKAHQGNCSQCTYPLACSVRNFLIFLWTLVLSVTISSLFHPSTLYRQSHMQPQAHHQDCLSSDS